MGLCGLRVRPGELRRRHDVPTTTPGRDARRVVEFFAAHSEVEGVGVGSFGPLDLDERSPRFGTITTTPKPGWTGPTCTRFLSSALDVPVAIETDVGAAAVGERPVRRRPRGSTPSVTSPIGTGIGGGAVVRGEVLHGLLHPELGHMLIPHDREPRPVPGLLPVPRRLLRGAGIR